MGKDENEIREGNPEPAALDEDLVEEVGFLGKVRGRKCWVVGLLGHHVWAGAGGGVEDCVYTTSRKNYRIQGEENRLHGGWEEWGSLGGCHRWVGGCCCCFAKGRGSW